jgi:hypothetical protein
MVKTYNAAHTARLMSIRIICLVITGAILALGAPATASGAYPPTAADQRQDRSQTDEPIAGDRMGTCYAFYQLDGQDLPPIAAAAGSRWDRFDFRWNVIEGESKRLSPFNFGPHDEIVNRNVDHGLNIIGILGSTPQWAAPNCPVLMNSQSLQSSTDGTPLFPLRARTVLADEPYWWRPCPPYGLDLDWNHPDNVWGNYVYETVSHFSDRVTVWEIWNEPDLGQVFWSGSPAQYAQLLKVGYQAVKAADPDATVLFAGLAYWSNPDYYVAVLDALQQMPGAAADHYYFDAMSLHLYSNIYQIRPIAAEIQANMAARVGSRPIWLTETGVPLWDEWEDHIPVEQLRINRANAEEAAAYVIEAFAESRAIGIEKFLFFRTHDEAMIAGRLADGREIPEYFGLIRNDLSLRPAYHAFSVAAHYLHGENQVTGPFSTGGARRITFWGTPQGRVDVLWNETGAPITYNHPAHLPTATLVDMTGALTTALAADDVFTMTLPAATADTAVDGSYLIGGPPLLIIQADTDPPTSTLRPLPDALYTDTLTLTWDVRDEGAGYWYSEIETSAASDGVWRPILGWAQTQAVTQTTVSIDRGDVYSFRIRARDHAGNWEPWPSQAQISTTAILTRTVALSASTYIDANSNGIWDADEISATDVTITWRAAAGAPITTTIGPTLQITETIDAGDYLLTAHSPGYLGAQAAIAVSPGSAPLHIERQLGLRIIRARVYLPLIARQP